jgi:BREX protein BrxB
MLSLDSTFAEVRRRLADPDALNPAKSDPLFYFVHEPADTLEVRRKLPAWIAALEHEGWTVDLISLADRMWQRIEASGLWDEWVALEAEADVTELNDGIRDVLRGKNGLLDLVRPSVEQDGGRRVVFMTDAALLHPFFRVHFLEAGLTNKLKVPVVLFYPGTRDGQFGLRFLGFYPLDGSYRSTLIGGIE